MWIWRHPTAMFRIRVHQVDSTTDHQRAGDRAPITQEPHRLETRAVIARGERAWRLLPSFVAFHRHLLRGAYLGGPACKPEPGTQGNSVHVDAAELVHDGARLY